MIRALTCLLVVTAVGIPAQNTLLVGPTGTYAQIRDAVAAAASGDLILVQPGTYAQFVADKSLTIRAITPGTVDVAASAQFVSPGCGFSPFCATSEPVTGLGTLASHVVHVRGLDFLGNSINAGLPVYHRVVVGRGHVTFEQCQFASTGGGPALLVLLGVATLQSCTLLGTDQRALHVRQGTANLLDTTLESVATASLATPWPAIEIDQGRLHASHVAVQGSAPVGGGPGGDAVLVVGRIWISDSVVTAGAGACALGLQNAWTVAVSRCTLTGACAPPPQTGDLLGVTRPGPLQTGATFRLDYTTAPNGFVAVFAKDALGLVEAAPFAQPFQLGTTPSLPAGLFLADANGLASATWPIPANPALVDMAFWFQGLTGLAFPLETSPVAGGLIR